MPSVNKAIIIGHLGADPELNTSTNGNANCTLSVATNTPKRDENGEWGTRPQWHRVRVWGEQAENSVKFLKKGRMVYVEGRIETYSRPGEDGKPRYSTEIVANRVHFLDRKPAEAAPAVAAAA